MKKITLFVCLVVALSLVSLVGAVQAADTDVLYLSPASSSVAAGSSTTSLATVATQGSKICVVKGTLVFNNLTCTGISAASDVIAQVSATCENPNFLVGIPHCTTVNKNLFTVTARGNSQGVGSISFANVNIIGEGQTISTLSTGANYTVLAPLPIVVTPKPKSTTSNTSSTVTTPTETTPTETAPTENTDTTLSQELTNQPAALANSAQGNSLAQWLGANWWWLLILIIALGLTYWWWSQREKNTKPQ